MSTEVSLCCDQDSTSSLPSEVPVQAHYHAFRATPCYVYSLPTSSFPCSGTHRIEFVTGTLAVTSSYHGLNGQGCIL